MDIIIVGGGIVGLTLANLLVQNTDLQLAIIEAHPTIHAFSDDTYDIRCSAITLGAQQIFADLGIWDEIIAARLGIYDKMLIWDAEPHNKLEFTAEAIKAKQLGYIIENRVIARALYNKLIQHPQIRFIHGKMSELAINNDHVELTVNQELIKAKLLIGADGAKSTVRDKVNIQTVNMDYKHHALVATIKTDLSHNNTAMQRFSADGPLAFLPLDNPHMCSIVWSCEPEKIAMLKQLPINDFCKLLTHEFANHLGSCHLQSERISFPLHLQHATQYVVNRVALVGDAAHVIHPLAGQGLNLGIFDAAALATLISTYATHDFGRLYILRKYERQRKVHNISMIALVASLKRIFEYEKNSIVNIRRQGLALINNLHYAKKLMINYATTSPLQG